LPQTDTWLCGEGVHNLIPCLNLGHPLVRLRGAGATPNNVALNKYGAGLKNMAGVHTVLQARRPYCVKVLKARV